MTAQSHAVSQPADDCNEPSLLDWLRAVSDQDMPETFSQVAAPVAWMGRTSTDDAQDPTLSLPRQPENSRNANPAGFVIVAKFYDIESGRTLVERRGTGNAHQQLDIPIPATAGSPICSRKLNSRTGGSWSWCQVSGAGLLGSSWLMSRAVGRLLGTRPRARPEAGLSGEPFVAVKTNAEAPRRRTQMIHHDQAAWPDRGLIISRVDRPPSSAEVAMPDHCEPNFVTTGSRRLLTSPTPDTADPTVRVSVAMVRRRRLATQARGWFVAAPGTHPAWTAPDLAAALIHNHADGRAG